MPIYNDGDILLLLQEYCVSLNKSTDFKLFPSQVHTLTTGEAN